MIPARRLVAAVVPGLLLAALAACGSDKSSTSGAGATTSAAKGGSTTSAAAATTPTTAPGVTTSGITKERCDANKAAGKITFLTSFDFSAAASILDVVVAKDHGYFEKMCLDVDLKPGFSTSNYPLVAANQAQFSSAGAYTEILNYSKGGASFVALVDYGKTPIEGLVVHDDGSIRTLQDLKGKTIGVKGDIPPSIVAMLTKAGLKRGSDYKEVQLQGYDPVAQMKTSIDALPVYKSNEPGQLDRAGVKYKLFDPNDYTTPGTFGIVYTSTDFLAKHPTAVQDFVRADLRGWQDAVADPASAVALAVKQINAAGNQNYLTQEGETFRWNQESSIVAKGTPSGEAVGLIDPSVFQAEVAAYAAVGVFPSGTPKTDGTYNPSIANSVFGPDNKVIWPS